MFAATLSPHITMLLSLRFVVFFYFPYSTLFQICHPGLHWSSLVQLIIPKPLSTSRKPSINPLLRASGSALNSLLTFSNKNNLRHELSHHSSYPCLAVGGWSKTINHLFKKIENHLLPFVKRLTAFPKRLIFSFIWNLSLAALSVELPTLFILF